ncbi:C39 family peptidase [Phenylobacterium sp.]|uniref:C39 family peptidase n=1 Tax=Phenylobacterium sp. TaxID=1871053 RepID=UPI002CEA88F6|nr:C39 family peptidase [Phenylobacterium sp.]HVI30575.1 C39 family peptidase [Phenylobacterium sp.]
MPAPVRSLAALIAALTVSATAPPCLAQADFNSSVGVFAATVTSLRDMPFRTVVRQQYDYSCGSAAVATLLRHHYGRPVDEAQVFRAMYAVGDQANIRRSGFSLLDMKTYLAARGLPADGFRETIDQLAARQAPAIVMIRIKGYRHFVVVKGVRQGQVLVGDPARGLSAYPARDFARIWNGVTFVIHPGAAPGRFNAPAEWDSLPRPPLRRLDDTSLASFTRELPPLYQITPLVRSGQ